MKPPRLNYQFMNRATFAVSGHPFTQLTRIRASRRIIRENGLRALFSVTGVGGRLKRRAITCGARCVAGLVNRARRDYLARAAPERARRIRRLAAPRSS